MIELRPPIRIGLCCSKCRKSLETHAVEPARGGRAYKWVVPVDTCKDCQEEQFQNALRRVRDENQQD
jgi:hypothetical protein